MDNEKEGFEEIRVKQAAYSQIKVRRALSYHAQDAIMRVNDNPDFFAGLPHADVTENPEGGGRCLQSMAVHHEGI